MCMDFTDLFAGVRVRDIADARAWYERLLGSEPAFFPNDIEAVWAVGEHRWFYLLEDAPKAGSALVTIMVADLDATAEAITRARHRADRARGLRRGAQVRLPRPRRQRDWDRPGPGRLGRADGRPRRGPSIPYLDDPLRVDADERRRQRLPLRGQRNTLGGSSRVLGARSPRATSRRHPTRRDVRFGTGRSSRCDGGCPLRDWVGRRNWNPPPPCGQGPARWCRPFCMPSGSRVRRSAAGGRLGRQQSKVATWTGACSRR